jgi:hypothetical protein
MNVTGKVSKTSRGLTSVLNRPSTRAAMSAEVKLATCTPEYRWATSNRAAASNNQRTMIFMAPA